MGFFNRLFNRFQFNGGEKLFMSVGAGFSFSRAELETILEHGYLSNPDVYSIVKKIADVGSDLPLKVYRKTNGKWEEVEGSDLLDIIEKPNQKQTTQEFIEECLVQLLNTGNVFIRKREAFGELFQGTQEMEIWPSAMVDIETNADWSVKQYVYNAATQATAKPEEVIHIKYIDPSVNGKQCHYGLSPLQAAVLTLDGSNNSHVADAHILKNKGISGLLSTDGDVTTNAKMGKAIQEAIQKQISGSGNYGKIPVASVPMKYVQTGMSPTDLKILEMNIQRLRTFCNVYGADSSLFNDPENKTYNNRLEAEKALYTNAVLPAVGKLLTGLNKELIEEDNTAIRADTSHVVALQQDKKAQAERLKILVDANILDENEAREELGYKPRTEINNNDED